MERFASCFDAKCYPFARKPLKQTYRKMLRELRYAPHQVAVLGDQLLTDMLGANRMHFYTILTRPLVSRDLNCTKVNRVFENLVFHVLEHQGKLKRGEYDDRILLKGAASACKTAIPRCLVIRRSWIRHIVSAASASAL